MGGEGEVGGKKVKGFYWLSFFMTDNCQSFWLLYEILLKTKHFNRSLRFFFCNVAKKFYLNYPVVTVYIYTVYIFLPYFKITLTGTVDRRFHFC